MYVRCEEWLLVVVFMVSPESKRLCTVHADQVDCTLCT